MNNLIDIGLNLTSPRFAKDMPEVIERAQQAGVSRMIITGTNLQHSEQAIELAMRYPGILYATAGVHPHHAKECDDRTLAILESFAEEPCVLSIGECGLDFNRNFSPPEVQEKWFEAQLELASGLGLPVFLHQRDAHARFIEILKHWRDQLKAAVAHCFTGNIEEVLSYIELDLHVGITGWICDDKRGHDLQQAVPHIPLNRLMIETDAPYLVPKDLPEKVKGNRNEPMLLPHICRAVAAYRNEELEELAASTVRVTEEFFNL